MSTLSRWLCRAVLVVPLAGLVVPIGATPADADPAVPTHYRSTVTEVVDTDGQTVDLGVEVLGGDTYLVVDVPSGTEVEVPGYDGEPYIRIHRDGEVEVNQRAPTRWLNDERYGSAEVEVPQIADAEAPPEWQVAAGSGTYAWHDHRIHVMSPRLPRELDSSLDEVQQVWPWEVPVVVDGTEATIQGTLAWVPGPGPVLPLLALVVMAALAVLAARRVGPDPLIVAAALVALGLGITNNVGLPPGAARLPTLLVLPVLSLVVVAIGWWLSRGGEQLRGPVLRLLAAVPPAVVAFMLIGALIRPIVPGLLPAVATRALVVAILALTVGSVMTLAGRLWAASSLDTSSGGPGEPAPGE